MPLYEYQCDACGHRFEVIQKFSDPLRDTCPQCGGAVRKLLSSPAIQFKGSGWYITDYAKKSGTGSAPGGKSGEAGAGGGSSDGASATGSGESGTGGKSDGAAAGSTSGSSGASDKPAPKAS